jgi:transposase
MIKYKKAYEAGRADHVSPEKAALVGAAEEGMVEEAEQQGMSISVVASTYGVHQSRLLRRRRLMWEGTSVAAGSENQLAPLSELKELKAEIRKLQRLLGKKTMEVEILKVAIRITPMKMN